MAEHFPTPVPAPSDPDVADRGPLSGRVAVVTGSTRGLGRAIAIALGKSGAAVVVHGRNREAADQVVAQLRQQRTEATAVLADISQATARDQLVESAWQWKSNVHIWVNNAGVDVLTGPLANQTFDEKLQRLWETDVQATIHLGRAAGMRMRNTCPRDGVILNMGWDQAEFGMEGDSGQIFGTVKGAIMAFTRSLAHSLAPHVRVNCLAPGWIRTAWGEGASPYWQARAVREALLERWGTPDDVAQTAVFLASPAASFINGQVLPINGGFRHGAPDVPPSSSTPSSPPVSRDG